MGTFVKAAALTNSTVVSYMGDLEIWVCESITAASKSVTVTTGSGSTYEVMATEVSAAIASYYAGDDVESTASSTNTNTVTPENTGDLILIAEGSYTHTVGWPSSPWSNYNQGASSSHVWGYYTNVSTQFAPSTTALSATWTAYTSQHIGSISIGLTFGSTTVNGAASPAAVASVSAGGVVSKLGVASPAAVASVSVAGTVTEFGVASPAATASVSVVGTVGPIGAATVAAVSSISAAGVVTRFGAATVAAVASVSVAATVTLFGGATAAATASVSTAATISQLAAAAPAVVTSVSAASATALFGAVIAAAVASITATGSTPTTSTTVTFNANGGTGTMAPESSAVPAALTKNTFAYVGRTFIGWNTLASGGGTSYADGAIYSFNANVTLYAQWSTPAIYVQGPISSRWLPAMYAPVLRIFAYADIWSGIGGTKLLGQVPVVSGSVTFDRANAVRRTASNVTFTPDAAGLLLPLISGEGLLYPTGVEIQLYKGCIYSDQSIEVASLGRFLVEETDVNDDTTGVTLIGTLQDRGYTVSRAKFTQPYATDGVSTVDVAIYEMISNQVPGLTYSFTPSTYVPPVQTYNIGDDPWGSAVSLAASAGMELFPDKNGILVLQPIIDPATIAPCAVYLEGSAAAPVALKREIANGSVPNVVVGTASGSGIATPIQTYWWDNNPESPTFYASGTPGPTLPLRDGSSTYPTLVQTLTTSAATTLAQLQEMVNAAGLGYVGTFEGLVLSIRDNPAHDVNDVITLKRAVAGITSPSNYIVDQGVIDLTSQNPLQLTTRLVVN